MGIDFGAQVLIVRYLSKDDFGAWSYALAVVALFGGVALFEMGNTLARFLPLYRERIQPDRVAGAVAIAFGVVLTLGTLIAVAIILAIAVLGIRPTDDARALGLVVIISFLIPIQGLDSLFTTLFATLGASRAIFIRQSLLAPGLRLAVVVALIVFRADVMFLATGYVAMSIVGLMLYAVMFRRVLRRDSETDASPSRRWAFPAREMLGFATPLLASTLVWLLMESSDAVLLGFFFDTKAVATFRVVLPMARLNQVVILTFAMLYLPIAARLHARGEQRELAKLYWQTAAWMTVLTFPILVLTFSFAESTAVGVYGERYAASAQIMAFLAVGYFFHTALGFNGLTLRIYGKLRYTVAIDVAMAILNIGVNLVLIPRFGPLGAAIGTTATLMLHNVLKQLGLWRYTGFGVFERQYVYLYASLLAIAVLLAGVQMLLPANLPIALAVASGAGLAAFWANRGILEVESLFPELSRLPILGRLLGTNRATGNHRDGA